MCQCLSAIPQAIHASLRIHARAHRRWALFLIEVLNYMLIEAMFVNRLEMTKDCFFGMVCLEGGWLQQRFAAVVVGFFLHMPASKIMYVNLVSVFVCVLHIRVCSKDSSCTYLNCSAIARCLVSHVLIMRIIHVCVCVCVCV